MRVAVSHSGMSNEVIAKIWKRAVEARIMILIDSPSISQVQELLGGI